MAGGWLQAGRLPLVDALAWADQHLEERKLQAHQHATQVWASLRTAYEIDPPTLED